MKNINNHRPYVFSAEMNLRSMYSLAVISYAAIMADGATGALDGRVFIPGQTISTFWINSIIIGSVSVVLITFFFYVRELGRAMSGENGVKRYEPKATSPMEYIKNAFVLLMLLFFIVVQTGHIYHGFQGGYPISEMTYVIHGFMCMAALAGIVGLFQTMILHLRFIKRTQQA